MSAMEPDSLEDDGLHTPVIGAHSRKKLGLIGNYSRIFSTGMKRKWDRRVYVDLFAGAGRARIRGTGQIVLGSPLIALSVRDRFDHHVFCEADEQCMSALRQRVADAWPDVSVAHVRGDCNSSTHEIEQAIEQPGSRGSTLTFCVVDPYSTDDLAFGTMSKLSSCVNDFLVLIASYMDVHRNEPLYTEEDYGRLDYFLGDTNWRPCWDKLKEKPGAKFGSFIVSEFSRRMEGLGYHYVGHEDAEVVRHSENRAKLYHLAFYTRHPRGLDFWKKARKSSDPQRRLPGYDG